MIQTRLTADLRRIAGPSENTTSDSDLLGRFVEAQDPEAFAEIVRRHGPMVLRERYGALCRGKVRS